MKLHKTVCAPIATLTLIGSLIGGANAAIYALDNSMTNLSAGIAVWNVIDGNYHGTLTLTSINSPNLLTAETNNFSWTLNPSILSDYMVVYEADRSGTSGGSTDDSGVTEALFFVADSDGSEWYFSDVASECVSGSAVYGTTSIHNGVIVQTGDSGSTISNSFISGMGGSNWRVGSLGGETTFDSIGWTMAFTSGGGGGQSQSIRMDVSLDAIPEPSSVLLSGVGVFAFFLRRSRH